MYYRILLLSLLLPCFIGCSAVLIPPTDVSAPRVVHLLEHGRHSSLLLTAADQSRVRYAYGDWAWYVDKEQGMGSGARALLLPSQAAFGRQLIAPAQPGERLASAVGVGIGQSYQFTVEAEHVDALLASLAQQFEAGDTQTFFSAERNLHFVPHSHSYTFTHNSNHMVADWMRALGITVRGNPALGNWRIDSTEDSD